MTSSTKWLTPSKQLIIFYFMNFLPFFEIKSRGENEVSIHRPSNLANVRQLFEDVRLIQVETTMPYLFDGWSLCMAPLSGATFLAKYLPGVRLTDYNHCTLEMDFNSKHFTDYYVILLLSKQVFTSCGRWMEAAVIKTLKLHLKVTSK